MAAGRCARCGGPLPPGAVFCGRCGTRVGAPLPSSDASTERPFAPPPRGIPFGRPGPFVPGGGGAPAAARRRAIVVAVVAILVIAAGIGAYVYYDELPTVHVRSFVAYAPDNVCGLGTVTYQWSGISGSPGTSGNVGLYVPNVNLTSCTLRSLTTNTSGFAISGVQLPGPIPGSPNPTSPNTGEASFHLRLPSSSWSGTVYLIFA